MKKLYIMFAALLLASTVAIAQKTFTEGVLTYSISIESVNGEPPVSNALNGALLTVYLTRTASRAELKNSLGIETTVFDAKSGKGFILKEYSGQQLMITMTEANRLQKNRQNIGLNFKREDAPVVINNFSAWKAEATSAEGRVVTVWYDPAWLMTNTTYNNAFPQIEGLPVKYQLRSGNIVFTYTLTDHRSEAIAASKFEAPKTGFRVMTFEENQQLKKGD